MTCQAADTWRGMRLNSERQANLSTELKRALQTRWRKRFLDIDVTLVNGRIETNGHDYHLVADGGRVTINDGTIGDLPITGAIDIDAMALDYTCLGLGKIRVVRDTRIRPYVSITLSQIDGLMRRSGFVNTKVTWNDQAQRINIRGVRPVRFLFLELRPAFTVSGRFHVQDEYVMLLDRLRIRVSGVLGFFARLALNRMERRASQRIDLRKDYRKLSRQGIRIAGGSVTLSDLEKTIVSIDFPPDPSLR